MKLNQLQIGTRLGGGFAVVLGLLVLVMGIGLWQLSAATRAMQSILAVPLAKERLTDEWFRSVAVGIRRTTAVAKSSDASLEALFAAEVKASTLRGTEIVKALAEMPSTPQETTLMATLAEQRKAYLGARDTVMQNKRDGHPDVANQVFESQYLPASRAYVDAMQALLDYERRAIDTSAAELDAQAERGKLAIGSAGGVAVLLGAAFAWLLTRSITRPLKEAIELTDAVAHGDLSHRASGEGRDEIGSLMQSIGSMTQSLRHLVGQVHSAGESIGNASSEIANGNQDLSTRTEQTASNLQQTASAMEQLTGTVKQSAASAQAANQLATSACEVAVRGGAVVSEVVTTMDEISGASKKIADIIGVIDGIAFQTNILALNAAVEAARAGEQGRGFAVVASEVRSLAQRSAEAAREIKALIGASVDKVEDGSRLVVDAGRTMEEIVSSVQRVSDIIGEISAAAAEQSSGISQVNGTVAQLDQMTQQNAALVEESAAAAISLHEQAGTLVQMVGAFRLGTVR